MPRATRADVGSSDSVRQTSKCLSRTAATIEPMGNGTFIELASATEQLDEGGTIISK
jgi:hypothetical protein